MVTDARLRAQGFNGCSGWKRALARIVERSHPDCRKIDVTMRAAAPLSPGDRSSLLEAVAAADGKTLGDGVVFRTIRETQLRYLDPPQWGTR